MQKDVNFSTPSIVTSRCDQQGERNGFSQLLHLLAFMHWKCKCTKCRKNRSKKYVDVNSGFTVWILLKKQPVLPKYC